jgi:hypothetical protein
VAEICHGVVSYNFVGMFGFGDGGVVFLESETNVIFGMNFSSCRESATYALAWALGITAAKGRAFSELEPITKKSK